MIAPSTPPPASSPRRHGPARIGFEPALGDLYRRARRLSALRACVARALAEDERFHLAGVSAAHGRLVVYADSAAWCTRLRYASPRIEAALAGPEGAPRIAFRTLPEASLRPLPRAAPAGLSPGARNALRSAARTIRDPALAAAVLRLAEVQPATGLHAGPA